MNRKRGLSPVIATVLLIAMVIVIGLIIFLWFKGISEETITKFGGTNVKLVCDEVYFEASYSNGVLYLSNPGNVPIFEMNVKISNVGSYTTKNLKDLASWPEIGLNQGGTFSDEVDFDGNEITLIPVLIGNSDKGKKTYACGEQYGKVIEI